MTLFPIYFPSKPTLGLFHCIGNSIPPSLPCPRYIYERMRSERSNDRPNERTANGCGVMSSALVLPSVSSSWLEPATGKTKGCGGGPRAQYGAVSPWPRFLPYYRSYCVAVRIILPVIKAAHINIHSLRTEGACWVKEGSTKTSQILEIILQRRSHNKPLGGSYQEPLKPRGGNGIRSSPCLLKLRASRVNMLCVAKFWGSRVTSFVLFTLISSVRHIFSRSRLSVNVFSLNLEHYLPHQKLRYEQNFCQICPSICEKMCIKNNFLDWKIQT